MLVPRVRVVHEGEVLAADVEVAESVLAKMRGLMFRRSLPDEFALVFPFDAPAKRSVHMLFVRVPIDVVWLADSRVTKIATLSPWRGFGRARADTIVELPAGAAAAVERGDRLRLESEVEVGRP